MPDQSPPPTLLPSKAALRDLIVEAIEASRSENKSSVEIADDVIAGLAPAACSSFQQRCSQWIIACFGEEIADDRLERADRLVEEVLEALQASGYPRDRAHTLIDHGADGDLWNFWFLQTSSFERSDQLLASLLKTVNTSGYSKDRAHALVDYVYDRPVGELNQEIGGVMVTLACFCRAHDIDMHLAGEVELARIWTKVDKIREKQKTKPTGSALPIPVSSRSAG